MEEKQERMEQKMADKQARMDEKADERQAKALEKSERIQAKLMEQMDKLDQREQALLAKVNSGEYLGPTLGGDPVTDTYFVSFDALDATGIGNDETDTFLGHITMENVITKSNNLKLKVTDCELIGSFSTYYCVFGKARATSSGSGGDKDSLVIIAFLEDDDENRNTLKISLSASSSLTELGSDSVAVTINSPQSKIASQWFIGGEGTIEITSSEPTVIETTTSVEEEAEEEAEDESNTVELEEDVGVSADIGEEETEAEEVEVEEETDGEAYSINLKEAIGVVATP